MKRKRILMFMTVLLVITAVVGAGYALYKYGGIAERQRARTEPYEVLQDAEKLAGKGDVDGAVKSIDLVIDEAGNDTKKSEYLTQKAVLLVNSGKLDEALRVANEAYALDKTTGTATLLITLYSQKKDNENTIKYMKAYISLLDKNDPVYKSETEQYKKRIIELGGE